VLHPGGEGNSAFAWVLADRGAVCARGEFIPVFFRSHYVAALTCLLLYNEYCWGCGGLGAKAALELFCCCARFTVCSGTACICSMAPEGIAGHAAFTRRGDAINHGNPERRIAIHRELAALPGAAKWVFVSLLAESHFFRKEWVFQRKGGISITARVVWARGFGFRGEREAAPISIPPQLTGCSNRMRRPPKLSR